jgi:DNA polymerase-3 subunit alpha
VVISKEPLNDVVPLEFTSRGDDDGAVMTQYSMEPVAALGLLKMDFLGLVNLTVLDESLKLIKLNHDIDLTLQGIPLDDKLTFDMLSRGETVGVFQLESSGMTRHIRELKPSTLGDVAAMIALFRPGPMDHIGTFIDGKRGRRKVTYIHPAMKEILEETYGVIVYQDQVLHIAREFAGYSLGEADIVRKAMGKKDPEIMAEEKTKFITGSLDKGHPESLAVKVFDLIEPFAGYAFNKAHSVSYGMVSYWTAYLKANYPAEYMASFMNSYMDKKDRLIAAVADCRRMGIEILAPDINKSYSKFTIEENPESGKAIRFGLAAIKNIGSEALRSFLDSRDQNGPYENLEQLCHDGDIGSLNRKAIECLVMAGSFDSFGDRTGLLEVSDRISSLAQDEANIRNSNQSTMFEMLGDSENSALSSIDIPFTSTSDHQKRLWEVELMGISISGAGNLGKLLSGFGKDVSVMLTQLQGESSSRSAILAGQISTVVDRFTRDNRPFKVVNIEVLDGSLEAVIWEDVLNKTAKLWEPGRIIKMKGNLRERDGEVTISVTEANEINLDKAFNNMDTTDANSNENGSILNNSAPMKNINGNGNYPNESESPSNRKKLVLFIRESNNTTNDQMLLDDIKRLLLSASGNDEVGLEIETESSVVVMEWPPVKINATPELESKLSALVGSTGKVTIQSLMF